MKSANPNIIAVPWANLPPELLEKISKRLPSKIDVRRIRAVCRSWRSSTPPYRFPKIKLPFPFDRNRAGSKHSGAYFTLKERFVYRIELPDSKDPDFWLVKVEFDDDGKAKILNPVTHWKIQIPPEAFNILDFDVTEVCRGYALRYVNPSAPDEIDDYYDHRHASKVVCSVNEENGEVKYDVMAIDRKFSLWRIKSGGKNWNSVQTNNSFYDVAIVEGQFLGADFLGNIWGFDSDYRAPPFPSTSLGMHMVAMHNGESALVEVMPNCDVGAAEPVVNVLVLARSEHYWEWNDFDAKAMNGCIIVVGDDCSFSLPTPRQHKGVRVFYANRYKFISDGPLYTAFECDCPEICKCFRAYGDRHRHILEGFHGRNLGVFDSETGKSGTALVFPEYATIFWPPPAWLNRA